MIQQRPGQKVFTVPGPDWGVQVIEPGPQVAAGGWWDDFGAIGCCVGAYQGRAVADYPTSLINLANPGVNDLVAVAGAPNWNAVQGWFNFDVLNTALDSGLIPAVDQSWSLIAQYDSVTGGGTGFKWATGMYSGANRGFRLSPRAGAFGVVYDNGGLVTVLPELLTGNLCVAGNQGYRNGVADGGLIGGWGGAANHSIYLGAFNNIGAIGSPMDGNLRAVAAYNCVLTAPQEAAVAANMAAI